MTVLGPEIADAVLAQCRVAAGEIGQCFARAFGDAVEVTVTGAEPLQAGSIASSLSGAGLAVVLHVGAAAAAVLIPQVGEFFPAWASADDASAREKLTGLANELGLLMLPEAYSPDEHKSLYVKHLASTFRAGGPDKASISIRFTLVRARHSTEAWLIWPLMTPHQISEALTDLSEDTANAESDWTPRGDDSRVGPQSAVESLAGSDDGGQSNADLGDDENPRFSSRSAQLGATTVGRRGLRDLPTYTRSLLKIRVPLSVTLAEKRQPLGQILEIGPGSILQFEKSCEEMLDLNVCNRAVARGEAVKVGDKFGLRVTSLILPGERFKRVDSSNRSKP